MHLVNSTDDEFDGLFIEIQAQSIFDVSLRLQPLPCVIWNVAVIRAFPFFSSFSDLGTEVFCVHVHISFFLLYTSTIVPVEEQRHKGTVSHANRSGPRSA